MDEDGSIVEAYAYEVYGKPTIKTGTGDDGVWFTEDDATSTTSSLRNPYLFTARRWVSDISLQYNRARWYSPGAGRWLSRDPAGYTGEVSLYAYTGERPCTGTDPYGLWTRPRREGDPRAVTCAQEGDTIYTLAYMIGLDPSDARLWLVPYDDPPVPGKHIPYLMLGYWT